jgi:transcriptional regulator GlxA family with amidase domain
MPHDIVFLVFDGVTLLDVSGPAEALAEAARRGADYRLSYASPTGGAVTTSIGTRLGVDARAADVAAAGTVIIPGADRLPTEPLEPELVAAAEHLVHLGSRVASVCTGAFLLAATGALTGLRATTHWQHAALLARAYPRIAVEPDALFVHEGRFHSSAGVTTGIDLTLALIEEDQGADVARAVARKLVMHLRRQGGQSQFSAAIETPPARSDAARRAVAAIEADPAGPHTLGSLATAVGVSPRHLARLFQAEIGLSPTRLVENHRLELASNLLLGGESVAETARRSGFASTETLRRVFQARFGMAPSGYRARFASTRLG